MGEDRNFPEKLDVPEIANGTVVPYGVQRFIDLEEARKESERKATLHFRLGIVASIICTIIGYLLGKYC